MEKRSLFVRTPKEFVATLPRYTYDGKIVIVQSEAEARRAVEVLRREPVLGFDTETRPVFRKGVVHKVALVQVASPGACFLFRVCQTGLTPELRQLLADPSILKIGLSLGDDLDALRHSGEFQPGGWLDLQQYVAGMGIDDRGLQRLYANVFRMRLSKRAQRSNWEADVLSDSQTRYAAADAYTCLQLYAELKRLRETGDYVLVSGEDTPAIPTT